MEHFTTTDARDLDWLFLGTVAGADYYEQRLILKVDGQQRAVVGRASDWPLIELRARNAELVSLLRASEQRSVEADCHVSELLTRLSVYQEHIAALEAAIGEQAFATRIAEMATNGHAPLLEEVGDAH